MDDIPDPAKLPSKDVFDVHAVRHAFEQFKHITASTTRQELLDGLFTNLLPSDIWYLTNLLGERQLFVDIIGLLPSEILIIVLSYVSAREVLSWHRVSKRWRERLSSEFICSQLRYLEYADEILSQRPQDQNVSNLEALRLCTFRSIAIKQSNRLATRKEISDLRPSVMAYWGGRLIVSGVMVGSELKLTVLYELFSDRRWKLQQSRESWYNLTCSEKICGGVTALGKCKVWSLRNPSTCQERQLLSSYTRDMASSNDMIGVVMDTELMLWDTAMNEELSTGRIQSFMEQRGLVMHRVGINATKEQTILLAAKNRHEADSYIFVFDFDENVLFEAPLAFTKDTRLFRPLQTRFMYVTCSGVRTLTKVDLDTFEMTEIGGFLTSGGSLVGVPFRDSIFMLEGSYLTRLTLTSYNKTEVKWSYYGILLALDQTSKMFDLQGDGHYICARMESGVLVFSFNLYDYQSREANSNVVKL
ncbi:uncharacterized protein V1518DRAFT_411819 [Limtongia smithiae]|uniref:uncharacterized protein n=1 Tax=Limtongia smithiae TaxID=1125753 RepID=UPI0034CDA238